MRQIVYFRLWERKGNQYATMITDNGCGDLVLYPVIEVSDANAEFFSYGLKSCMMEVSTHLGDVCSDSENPFGDCHHYMRYIYKSEQERQEAIKTLRNCLHLLRFKGKQIERKRKK